MTLEELGAVLRTEREKHGLSIENAAETLKISLRVLRALENGDAALLPPLAYTKGFVRTYGAYVGISPEEIHGMLASLASTGTPQPCPPPVAAVDAAVGEDAPARSGGRAWLWLLLLALLGAGAFAVWRGLPTGVWPAVQEVMRPVLDKLRPSAPESLPPAAAPAAPETSSASEGQRQEDRRPADSRQDAEPPQTQASAARPSAGGQAAEPQAAPATPPPAPVAPAASASSEAAGGLPHKLIITAVEDCWVHSSADTNKVRQFSLRRGETFALMFTSSLDLKLGNAGGVRLRYDGRDLPPAGKSGEVRSLAFPSAGAVAGQ